MYSTIHALIIAIDTHHKKIIFKRFEFSKKSYNLTLYFSEACIISGCMIQAYNVFSLISE